MSVPILEATAESSDDEYDVLRRGPSISLVRPGGKVRIWRQISKQPYKDCWDVGIIRYVDLPR